MTVRTLEPNYIQYEKKTNNTIPSYGIKKLPERKIESLLNPTKLAVDQNKKVLKTVNIVRRASVTRRIRQDSSKSKDIFQTG